MQGSRSGLIYTGYFCCFVALAFLPAAFAMAALVIGITVFAKGRPRHGVALSLFAISCGLAGMAGPHKALMALETSIHHGVNQFEDIDDLASVPVKTLHETLSVGKFTYRCNDAQWQTSASSPLETREAPNAAYMVVDLSIRNDDRTEANRPQFKLVDSENNEFSESPESQRLSDSISTSDALNPGVTTRGRILFDVPPGRSYKLKVSGGDQSDKYALIDLMWQQQQTGSQSE